MGRLLYFKSLLTFFSGLGLAAIYFRFYKGLGLTTNLTDYTPWGLWIGLDVMAGVALAAGGFVICALVHIFHLKKFYPLLRATVLTAFLGYALVPLGLLLDLGLPWNIWHPMIYWQHHSFLFEVALCVMLYGTVLTLEFLPVILEHPLLANPLLQKIYHILRKASLPLVIIGIMLSTLHQSSLGALFLVMPLRTHPLWYSPLISLLFLVSAIGLGLAMIIFESLLTSYLYKHKPKLEILGILGRISSIVLSLYCIIRLGDLIIRGQGARLFDLTWQSKLFWLEMLISVIIPVWLFNHKTVRKSTRGLFVISFLVVSGFILNRLNISIITFARPEGGSYFPSLVELSASLGLFSLAGLVFLFFVEHVNLFAHDIHYLPQKNLPVTIFTDSGYVGPFKILNQLSLLTIIFVVALASGFSIFQQTTRTSHTSRAAPVKKAKALTETGLLEINSGDSEIGVRFNHRLHQDTLGQEESCGECHHLLMQENEITPCYHCHRDMYQATFMFDHLKHQSVHEEKGNCLTCHPGERSAYTFKPCQECHSGLDLRKPPATWPQTQAPAYMDAMHKQCPDCHVKTWPQKGKPTPDYCNTCHVEMENEIWRKKYKVR